MMLTYKAMYKYLDKTVFGQVLDFPGAMTEGRNPKHAHEMLASALADMAEACILRGSAPAARCEANQCRSGYRGADLLVNGGNFLMAHFIAPQQINESTYRGLRQIFQFTNHDGVQVPCNCGQAAAATYLTACGVRPPLEDQAESVMKNLEAANPPDIFGGWFGTSRECVVRICASQGLSLQDLRGEQALRDQLSQSRPVMVMLDVPGRTLFNRWTLPTGHWMVAYGFDDELVYLTNWGTMTWELFRARWNGLTPRLIGMCNRGLLHESHQPET